MRAAMALSKGDWTSCIELYTSLEVWNLVLRDSYPDAIKTMLEQKIKLEGLQTYLFAFSAQYISLSLDQLCAMLKMTENDIQSVISKMMINCELYVSWDQPTATIVLCKVEPSPVQVLALQFAEKAGHLVDAMNDFWMLPVAIRMITGRAVEGTKIKKVIALETEADLEAIAIKEVVTVVVASNPLVVVVIYGQHL
jgi:hypothetical protein